MAARQFPNFGRLLGVVLAMAVLVLAGCGGGSSGSANGPGAGISLTVGSKNDADGQLLGEMYTLLLQHQGFSVTPKLHLGQTPVLDTAIKSGQIDIYPEFTGTAAGRNNLPSTQDAQALYTEVKNYYAQNYQIAWLDPAYQLNDSYGICTSQDVASRYHLTSIDDLEAVASQLKISTQSDGIDAAINPVKNGYGINFKQVVQVNDQDTSYAGVKQGSVDLLVCYTTEAAILVNNFVLLKDTKNVFPIYNPAPIIRNDALAKSSAIATTLNPLETHLTTEKQVALIKQVSADGKQVKDVAQKFLQDEGLLPAS